MDDLRLNKVSRLVQKELSEIFQRDGITSYNGNLISVTTVRMSSDLALAKVYLSIFTPKGRENAFNIINENKKAIRFQLGKKIKNQVKAIPELAFFIDDSIEYANRIDELLKK
ncbi:MAG: ribosome-binding factor A [Bacteroidetes bacterium CG02_land_8_20_14_3_00_31_25]|nr:30S ribosome-binding factor RbfA [Bacteroidota bacterium]PIV58033.1 MAG: ribosome-binding factor A [Bacteroidetes bacterium CG02_land_8_20_14_3_00_31_25]PIX35696.1 MAG: ribosome-binding factor A [Bacteroidetes bacterium CG_4_8_14_3_um_filter_31_14]